MRTVFVVIERRADYSRFRPILKRIQKDPFFKLHIVVTGICLLPLHGNDIKFIKKDGFKINSQIPMFFEDEPDTGGTMVRAMARFMKEIVNELEKTKPDIVLSGFDIGANFALTIAASHMNIPVAHIQGGEVSGSIDESIRHAMSKFAHFHFPATKKSKKRLVQMGEDPRRIFVVGCPSIDTLLEAPIIPKEKLEKEFGVSFDNPVVLVIQHPVTTEATDSVYQIKETLEAIKEVNVDSLMLYPNNDAGYLSIMNTIKSSKIRSFASLRVETYANLLRNVSVLVGNSSSGIHEAATFGLPVVNIGTRQKGRERGSNVIDTPYDKKLITKAIKKAIWDKSFLSSIKKMKNLYGNGGSAEKIVSILKRLTLNSTVVNKRFYE